MSHEAVERQTSMVSVFHPFLMDLAGAPVVLHEISGVQCATIRLFVHWTQKVGCWTANLKADLDIYHNAQTKQQTH